MRRGGPDYLRWISIGLLLAAVVFFFFELIAFSRQRARLPEGLTVGGVPVGGLSQTEAVEHILQTYSSPVELHYDDQIILMSPASVGFRLDTEVMLAAAESMRTGDDFWSGFMDFLWNRPGEEAAIPLRAEYSVSQLELVLADIAARYDEPPYLAEPIPGTPNFNPGRPGRVLDIDRAQRLIGDILMLPHSRVVNLPVLEDVPPRPTLGTLEILIKQIVDGAGFPGLTDLFLVNLRSGEELHIVYLNGEDIPAEPDVSFGAASTIKIGIMTAYFIEFDEPFGEEADDHMFDMITRSGNESSDWLMEQIGGDLGPLAVTDILQSLGLNNTFSGGFYYLGAPLLRTYNTPANQRTDINTRPDKYTQTTPSDIGMLLMDIYHCENGGGALLAVYPDRVTPQECSHMIDLLAQNKIGSLIEAGVPDGTRVAHKHGWPSSPFDMIGDAGIVYTPGGDYVFSMFLFQEQEMFWDPTSKMFADISRAVYNYFNPPVE